MAKEKTELRIAGTTISVSNLDKFLYPAAQFSKAEVIKFYADISKYILPHLKNRPVTLKRYPDGVHSEPFWEKDAPDFTPDWVKRFPVPRKMEQGDICYILINDVKTLVWCASIATIEFHAFLHTIRNLNAPTSIVFDLDPGEGANILKCAEVAFLLRDTLESFKLKSFPKVSGSKGIQIHVPLNNPHITYEQTKPFAQAIAEMLHRQHPDLIVSDMAKILRTGKIFIDWSQNIQTKTTVGVYSMRAKRERPYISMPVIWEELSRALKTEDTDALRFDPAAALSRLKKLGDLYAPVLKLKQKLPPLPAITQNEPRSKRFHAPKSLKSYTAKRNFKRTAEPTALPRRSLQGGKRRFVVQKHAASHLHYDFRLEMHDVLKSWSVPKGVPTAKDETRTAIAVEDHPTDYMQFEGIIPQGQYGGGTVMVWDIGTYEVIDGNYYKGRLQIFLSGKKLKGEWLLEKQRTISAEKSIWSLTKVAKNNKRISAKAEDRSALTNRTIEEIAEAKDATWQSNRSIISEGRVTRAPEFPKTSTNGAKLTKSPSRTSTKKRPRTPQPTFISPMLATPVEKLPDGHDWEYEVKWDGHRIEAIKHGDHVRLYSRKGKDQTATFPNIAEKVSGIDADTAVLDGEVVAIDPQGRPSFQHLQNRAKLPRGWQIVYYAFDLLNLDGEDLRKLPLTERKQKLERILGDSGVLFSHGLEGNADEIVNVLNAQNLEGVVAKKRDSRYDPGKRNLNWLKLPLKKKQEFVIGGFRPETKTKTTHDTFQLLIIGYYKGKNLIYAGKVRIGLNPMNRKSLIAAMRPLIQKKCPFANLPNSKTDHFGESITADDMDNYVWIKPKLVAAVAFTEWTDGCVLRHAAFEGLREDKEPIEVVREDAVAKVPEE
jgi:bifunctional non-homologous end joining protein LigD